LRRTATKIVPIILAAGKSARLGFPKPLARFGKRTALEIAVENCAGLGRPVVILGWAAARVRRTVPAGTTVVVNRGWRAGQLSSLQAGLGRVAPRTAFMLYPVDYPLLTPAVLRRLVGGFRNSRTGQSIIAPVYRGRLGHPVIFAPELRVELATARTAKEVVFAESPRVKCVKTGTAAIWQDFNSPATYRRRRRDYLRRTEPRREQLQGGRQRRKRAVLA